MNKVTRAFRLYLRAAANPIVIAFGLLMMIGLLVAFIVDPDPVGSKDYGVMLGCIQFGKIGVLLVTMLAIAKIRNNKFYISCNCAKEMFTIVPVSVVMIIAFLYDIVLEVIAYVNLGMQGFSDMLVVAALSSLLVIIAGVCIGRGGVMGVLSACAYFAYMMLQFVFRKESIARVILGQTVTRALIIAVCCYIVAIAVTFVMANYWWKKGNRFYPTTAIRGVINTR